MVTAAKIRTGFSLVELMVALVVFACGILGAMATVSLAARRLREAEARQRAVWIAGSVLDSLVQLPAVGAGALSHDRYRVRWSTGPVGAAAAVELEVRFHDGTANRTVRFHAVHSRPLVRPGAAQ